MPAATPFVKWVGGKRQLLAIIRKRLPKTMENYYEPMVGGGAVFFALANRRAFKNAVINDLNLELIEAYQTLQEPALLDEVISLLKTYVYEETFYYEMRAQSPSSLDKAHRVARFLYLNRTCYNGLYRVNRKGEFNAPFGDYTNPMICDENNLREAALALAGVRCTATDYATAVAKAGSGDVVYIDPPYLPRSLTSNFTSYTKGGFPFAEHERLASIFRDLANRGVKVLLSNTDQKVIRDLYHGFRISRVSAVRNINSDGEGRGVVNEILVSANLP
jgi:DNA adenine methylase